MTQMLNVIFVRMENQALAAEVQSEAEQQCISNGCEEVQTPKQSDSDVSLDSTTVVREATEVVGDVLDTVLDNVISVVEANGQNDENPPPIMR